MARNTRSPFEDFVVLSSKLPWWVCILLAIISYFVLHGIASTPAPPVKDFTKEIANIAAGGIIRTAAMFGQYILPFAFILATLISGIGLIKRRKLYESVEKHPDVTVLNEITWQDFERLVGEYYRRQAFRVTQEGSNGPDGGVDLVLRKGNETYLVQCKQWKAFKVGAQPVREFYGVMTARGAAGGYFVTSGVYTEDAREFVRGLNIELIDGLGLRKMIDVARREPTGSESVAAEIREITPKCPKCGAEMKRRIARQGKNAGKEFWGCVSFPDCRGVLPM